MYTSMHSGGLELTKLTHTRLEDHLIRHRSDRVEQVKELRHSENKCPCLKCYYYTSIVALTKP